MACAINTIAGNLIKWTFPTQEVVHHYDVYRMTADITSTITTSDIVAKVSFATNLFFDTITVNATHWYRIKSISWSKKSSSYSVTISAILTGTLSGSAIVGYVEHSAVSVIAGVGMSGGGTLTSSVTLNVDTAVISFIGHVHTVANTADAGFLLSLNGTGTTYLSGTGGWTTPAGGSTSAESISIGTPTDTDWTDGIHGWSASTTVADALDDCNETLSYLAPADASSLAGSLTAAGTTKYKARLSNGGGAQIYKAGQTAGDTTSAVISDGNFILRHINSATTFNKADEGYTRWYIAAGTATYSVQNSILHTAEFSEGSRTGSQSANWSSGALTVTYVGMYNSFPKWQRGNAEIAVTSTLLTGGYNKIKLTRECGFTTQESNDYEIWFDTVASTPVIGTASISANTPVYRWLSGVKMYWKGSTWDFNLSYASAWCDNVYDDVRIFRITSTDSLLGDDTSVDYDDGGVTGASTPPAIGDTLSISAFLTTTTTSASRSMDARMRITCYNAYGSSDTADTPSSNIMVDTTDSTSTTLNEYFDDENRRLPSTLDFSCADYTLTGQWTSTAALTNGNAQVWNGSLRFPTIDFTAGYLPTGQTANYSVGFTTAGQTYYRSMYDSGADPHSSGQIELGNLVNADVVAISATGGVHAEIRLPGETDWLDLGKSYNAGTFSGAAGDGCKTSQSGDDWYWTAGAFSTTNSGDRYYIRITIYTSGKTLTQIRELGW